VSGPFCRVPRRCGCRVAAAARSTRPKAAMPASAPPVVMRKSRRDNSKAPTLSRLAIHDLLSIAPTRPSAVSAGPPGPLAENPLLTIPACYSTRGRDHSQARRRPSLLPVPQPLSPARILSQQGHIRQDRREHVQFRAVPQISNPPLPPLAKGNGGILPCDDRSHPLKYSAESFTWRFCPARGKGSPLRCEIGGA